MTESRSISATTPRGDATANWIAHVLRSLAVALALAASTSHLAAQGAPGAAQISGSCTALKIAGKPSPCGPAMASFTLPDGTVMFMFKSAGSVIAFGGAGSEAMPSGNGSAAWAVKFVNLGEPGKETVRVDASGVCRFENPFKGKAGTWCSAKTDRGEFSATFRSNGKPPVPAR